MRQQFKAGDIVRYHLTRKVVSASEESPGSEQWLMFEDGGIGFASGWFELAEPSVTVSKIREVCEAYYRYPTGLGIEDVFQDLTGEPLQKEQP